MNATSNDPVKSPHVRDFIVKYDPLKKRGANEVSWCPNKPKKERQLNREIMKKGIKISDMKGKWTDILINVRYSRKEDGFMKVWINDKLILESLNIKTFTPYTNKGAKLEWGIYQTGVSYWKNKNGDKPYPSMVVYFDEVNQGSSKEKVIKNLGN